MGDHAFDLREGFSSKMLLFRPISAIPSPRRSRRRSKLSTLMCVFVVCMVVIMLFYVMLLQRWVPDRIANLDVFSQIMLLTESEDTNGEVRVNEFRTSSNGTLNA